MNRIIALMALLTFAAFIGIIAFRVRALDLTIISIIGVGLASWDFWRQLFSRKS
ncbi:hypothetical protein [Phyllobacterium phragmitis]|uniref:hypothetical protein n=1 Tax=Phyllobacterium phragmitis TaxID=2670329 RepID=UPI001304DEE8|nr:hypothetical protein [Phyllobacterium phragmitis]